jgi:hypothetical protein
VCLKARFKASDCKRRVGKNNFTRRTSKMRLKLKRKRVITAVDGKDTHKREASLRIYSDDHQDRGFLDSPSGARMFRRARKSIKRAFNSITRGSMKKVEQLKSLFVNNTKTTCGKILSSLFFL